MARIGQTHDVSARGDTLDRAVFIIAFLLGVVGGIIIKALAFHPFVGAGYAILILVSYAVFTWAGGRVRIEPETIGDNCYYLGFLFTLASLSYTLYQLADPSLTGGRPIDIPEVISGFGVALSSTIFGVFLRVIMMQVRTDFVAREREVRADMNRAFGDFRKNMSGMLSQMKAYSAESVQLASERDERIRTSTEKFSKDYQDMLKANANAFSEHMKKTLSDATEQAMKDAANSLIEVQKGLQKQMESALEATKNTQGLLREQENKLLKEMEAGRQRMITELEKTETVMKNQKTEIEACTKAMRDATEIIEKELIPAFEALEKRTKSSMRSRIWWLWKSRSKGED